MTFVEAPCPHCHAILRRAALSCWRCGLDLTQPERGPAPAAEQAPRDVLPPEDPDDLGPCPSNALARFCDPRLPRAELERSVRGYALLPWSQSYYRMGAALLGFGILRGRVHWWTDPLDPPPLWLAAGAPLTGEYVYAGSAWPLAVGAIAWTVALVLGAWALLGSPRVPHALAAVPLVALYVVLVVLSKAIRVAIARRRYVRRMSAGHLGEV